MTKEELKARISGLFPVSAFDEAGEWLNVHVEEVNFTDAMHALHRDPDLSFDFIFCLTCVDWKTHFTMVYHLRSLAHRHMVVVKVKLDRTNPEISSVCGTWRTAELLEREVFDLFGVKFKHHPDLRRLILTDDWVGYPLRKDYDDPVNIIKL